MRQIGVRQAALITGVLLIASGLLVLRLGGAVDRSLHVALHFAGPAPVLRWLLRLTDLGGGWVMIPLALATCICLALRRRFALALWLFATVATGRIIVELAKIGF